MKTPRSTEELILLSNAAIRGLTSLGVTVGIKQNTAAATTTDLETVIGRAAVVGPPALPAIVGKRSEYAEAKALLRIARATFRVKQLDALTFAGEAVDWLKRYLGRRWNPRWEDAGFTGGTIAVAEADPLDTLLNVAAYLRAHPEKENAPGAITATQTQVVIDALELARGAVATERSGVTTARQGLKAALQTLRDRLTALRNELSSLLSDDDARWYQFGFTRPADGHLPAPVTGLHLQPSTAGQVIATWEHSAVALNYRVRWRLNQPDAVPVEIGLVDDLTAVLSGLPTGQSIQVGVSARNSSGETAVTEAAIVVP